MISGPAYRAGLFIYLRIVNCAHKTAHASANIFYPKILAALDHFF